MCELVAHGARDLRAQQVGIVPEVAQQGVAEDDDPVVVVVAGDGVALVEAVGALLAALVGDHDRHAIERLAQDVREVVQRVLDELLEVDGVVRVELQELALVGLGGEVLAREALGADHEALELGLALRVLVVRHAGHDQPDHDPGRRGAGEDDREHLEHAQRAARREALDERDDGQRQREAQHQGDGDTPPGRPAREHWIEAT